MIGKEGENDQNPNPQDFRTTDYGCYIAEVFEQSSDQPDRKM